jgi:dsRNA-specific ribonuclease
MVTDAGLSASGTGTSRQRAEQEAARAMLEKLET